MLILIWCRILINHPQISECYEIKKYFVRRSLCCIPSCELPTFKASDSFIAFTSSTATVTENDSNLVKIEVLCSSLDGIDASVEFEIVPRALKIDSTVLKIEIMHATIADSIIGYRDSVVYDTTDTGAKEGVHFTFSTNCLADPAFTDSNKLVFTKKQYSDTIYIKAIATPTSPLILRTLRAQILAPASHVRLL